MASEWERLSKWIKEIFAELPETQIDLDDEEENEDVNMEDN